MATYYNNYQLSKRFGIGASQMRVWIDKSLEGKNSLQVEEVKQKTNDTKKFQILVSEHNEIELERLFQHGKVSRRHVGKKVIDFYPSTLKIFNSKQLHELISAVKVKYIPLKFTYMHEGASDWDSYVKNGLKEKRYTATLDTQNHLSQLMPYLMSLKESGTNINVVDVGSGNFLPVANFIKDLDSKKLLNKYIAIDISSELLEITKNEATKIIPESKIITVQGDIEIENFQELCRSNAGDKILNIFLFVGGTFGSFLDSNIVLRHLRDSMDEKDILIFSNKLEENKYKVAFNHVIENDHQLLWIPEVLGFETSKCPFFARYDEQSDARLIGITLDQDYQLKFHLGDGIVSEIFLQSGEELLLWHHKMTQLEGFLQHLSNTGLRTLSFITTKKSLLATFICMPKALKDRI